MTESNDIETIESEAAAWVSRRDLAEHWTPELEQELQSWIARSPAHHIAWLRMSAAWQRMDRLADAPVIRGAQASVLAVGAPDADNDAAAVDAAARQTQRSARRTRLRTIVAGALAAGIAIGIGVATVLQIHERRGDQYETRVGAREAVTLADGSHVTLNTHTRGRAVVNERERRFWLEEGEAYFEIARDPSRPFVVLAGRDRVTVLGTKFSVRHEGGRTEVTVLEGRVRLDPGTAGAVPVPVVMTRNEAAVSTAGNVLVIAKDEQAVRDEISWREGRLVFDQLTLEEVAARFNRYNDTQLVVEGAAAARRFSGSFEANNVEGFARLLDDTFGLEVRRDGERIVVGAN